MGGLSIVYQKPVGCKGAADKVPAAVPTTPPEKEGRFAISEYDATMEQFMKQDTGAAKAPLRASY